MTKYKGNALTTDVSPEWEIRSIAGQKIVGQEVFYRVNWEPTWVPESALDGARYLIEKFLAQLYEPQESWNGRREGGCSKRGWQKDMECGILNKAEPKKRRGRLRKEMTAKHVVA